MARQGADRDKVLELDECRGEAARLRASGSPIRAYDVANRGLSRWPEDPGLTHVKALSLADCGALEMAERIMQDLMRQGHRDEETLSIFARTQKDSWLARRDPEKAKAHLALARDTYFQCFKETGGYYPGINAATLAAIMGEKDKARALAAKVRDICLKSISEDDPGLYYILATLGEACLALGKTAEAEDWYAKAGDAGRGRYRDLASTRRNMRLLAKAMGLDPAPFENALPIPAVAVFTGHIVDRPDRENPRFPDGMELENKISEFLKQRISAANIGFGYGSLAAGADIIFLEALSWSGGEAHGVLPYNPDDFMANSVDVIPGSSWPARFQALFDSMYADGRIRVASQWPMEQGSKSYDYANRILYGLSRLKAWQLGSRLVPMAVWDGNSGDGPGGTAHTIAWWNSMGHDVEIIDLAALRDHKPPRPLAPPDISEYQAETAPEEPESGGEFIPQIKAILFADVVHYSALKEHHVPLFVKEFMGRVARLADRADEPPLIQNAWGDAVYFVFDTVRGAGNLALALSKMVRDTDWGELGLPPDLNLRIALHAGPVYCCHHPVIREKTFTGTHVSRAARLEPITPEGHVYASEPFAAIAAAEEVDDFHCIYVGQVGHAKGFGEHPTYLVKIPRTKNN